MAIPVELPKLIHEENGPDRGSTESSSSLHPSSVSQRAEPASFKTVRKVSKLSSRHRRRKHLGADEDRASKRIKDRIPIPAFTSIPSEYYDFGFRRNDNGGRAPEPSKAVITTPSDSRDDTAHCLDKQQAEVSISGNECKDDDAEPQLDIGNTRAKSQEIHIACLEESTSSTLLSQKNREDKECAQYPWDVGQNKGTVQVEIPTVLTSLNSASCLTTRNAGKGVVADIDSGAAISSMSVSPATGSIDNMHPSSYTVSEKLSDGVVVSLKPVVTSESSNETKSFARSTATPSIPAPRECSPPCIERKADERIGNVLHNCQSNQSQTGNIYIASAGLVKDKVMEAEMSGFKLSTLSINLSSAALKSFVSEESSSSIDVSQANRVIDLCSNDDTNNISKGKNEKLGRSEYFRSNSTRQTNSVDIVQKSVEGLKAISAVSKLPEINTLPLAKSEKSSKSDHAKRKQIRGNSASLEEKSENTSNNASKRKQSLVKHRTETRSRAKSGGNVANKNQTKTTAGKKKLCSACSTCDCTKGGNTITTPLKFSSLSGSDARQEQSLINRLQRIEREIAWKEGQRHDIARALKKHQLKMLRKWGDSNSVAQKPRFLADVDLSDEVEGPRPKIDSNETICAKNRVFGKQKSEQPTLTQMIRDQTRDDDHDDAVHEMNGKELLNACHDATSLDDHADFLSFWTITDPMESTQRYGSMSYFKNALANSRGVKFIDHWAKATANMIRVEDEGFDALVTLFDESIEKNYAKSSSCDSPSIYDDDDRCTDSCLKLAADPLTPESKTVANQIETSVRNDHQQMVAIERICPQWAENIEFAQAYNDPDILQRALQNVTNAAVDLEGMKNRILQAFMDRQRTLELFAKSIQVSKDRLDDKQDEVYAASQ